MSTARKDAIGRRREHRRRLALECLEQRLLLEISPYEIAAAEQGRLREGLARLKDWAGAVSEYDLLAQSLPVVRQSLGGSLNLMDALDRGLVQPLSSLLATGPVGPALPSGDLVTAIIDLGANVFPDLDVTIGPGSVSGGRDIGDGYQELVFNLVFEVDRSVTSNISLGPRGDELGFTFDATCAFTAGATLDFSFGMDLDPELPLEDAFFVRVRDLNVTATAAASGLSGEVNASFYKAELAGGSLDLNAALGVGLNDPDSGTDPRGNITLNELTGTPLSSLVTLTPSGSAGGSLSLKASSRLGDPFGLFGGGLSPVVSFATTDPFTPPNLSFNADFDELLNFTNLDSSKVAGMLDQVGDWLSRLSSTSILSSSLHLGRYARLGDVLNLGSAITDAADKLLAKLTDSDGRLVLACAQELGGKLEEALGLSPGTITASYSATTHELSYTLVFPVVSTATTLPPDFGIDLDLSPLGNVKGTANLTATATAEATLTLGADLSPLVAELVAGANAPADGRLADDAVFRLTVGETSPVLVTVHKTATEENAGLDDLVANFNTALAAAGVDSLVSAALEPDPDHPGDPLRQRLKFVTAGKGVAARLQIDPGPGNPVLDELGFSDGQEASGSSYGKAYLVADGYGPDDGRLSGDAVFRVTVGEAEPVTVTLAKAATDTNASLDDLVADLNDALDDAGLGSSVGADLHRRLALRSAHFDDGLLVTATPGNELGLSDGQEASGSSVEKAYLVADNQGPANGRLSADAVFQVKVGEADPVTVTLRKTATVTNAGPDDLVADLNQALHDAGLDASLTATLDKPLKLVAIGDGVVERLHVAAGPGNAAVTGLGFSDGQVASDSIGGHAFVENATITGAATVSASQIEAKADFGYVEVQTSAGTGTADVHAALGLKAPGDELPGGRVYLTELVDALDSDITTVVAAQISGSLSVHLPLQVESDVPGVSLPPDAALDFTADFAHPEQLPDLTFLHTELLSKFANVAGRAIANAFVDLGGFLRSIEGWMASGLRLPGLDQSIGRIVAFAGRFLDLAGRLKDAPARVLQELKEQLRQGLELGDSGVAISLAEGDSVLRIDVTMEQNVTRQVPINVDMKGLGLGAIGRLVNLTGTGLVTVEAGAVFDLDFGIDLADPDNPRPFVYDTSNLTLSARANATNIEFSAGIGALRAYVQQGSVLIDADDNSATPDAATLAITLDDKGTGRVYLDELTTSDAIATLNGQVHVVLPVYCPTEADPRGNIEVAAACQGDTWVFGTLSAPDFSGLLQVFDLLKHLDGVPDAIGSGIASGFDYLLGGVRSLLAGKWLPKLPMIGDQLDKAAHFLEEIQRRVVDEINDRFSEVVDRTPDIAQKALYRALGPESQGGLGLLEDHTGDGFVTRDDVVVGLSDTDHNGQPDQLDIDMRLGKSYPLADTVVRFDTGIPALGLEVNAPVQLALEFGWDVAMGINLEDGFYFDTSAENELTIDLTASIPGLHATGTLGFFQVDVTDGSPARRASSANLSLAVDLRAADNKLTCWQLAACLADPTLLGEFTVTGGADINLGLVLSLGGDARFPSISADLGIDWDFGPGAEHPKPDVAFENVRLNVGEFISDFAGPLLRKVQKVTKPMQKVVDFLTEPIPLLQKVGVKVTPLDAAKALGYRSLVRRVEGYLDTIKTIVGLVNSVPVVADGGSYNAYIPLGRFDLVGVDLENKTDLAGVDPQNVSKPADPQAGLPAPVQGFLGTVSTLGIQLPILNSPEKAVFRLLMGQFADADGRALDLVTYRMPKLELGFHIPIATIPIYPPFVNLTIRAYVGAGIDLKFGFDTHGFAKYIQTDDWWDIFSGFYVSDTENPDGTGKDVPEGWFTAGVSAKLKADALIASASLTASVDVTFNADLHDTPPPDGKIHVDEFLANLDSGLGSTLDFSGVLKAKLTAEYKVLGFSGKRTIAKKTIPLTRGRDSTPKEVYRDRFGDSNNDEQASATDLGVGLGLHVDGLSIETAGDQDWYKFELPRPDSVDVDVRTSKSLGKLNLEVFDADGRRWEGHTDRDREVASLVGVPAGTYYAHVTGDRNNYMLAVEPGKTSSTRVIYVNPLGKTDDHDSYFTTEPGDDGNSGLVYRKPKATLAGVAAAYDLGPNDLVVFDTGQYTAGGTIAAADQGATYVGTPAGSYVPNVVVDSADDNRFYKLGFSGPGTGLTLSGTSAGNLVQYCTLKGNDTGLRLTGSSTENLVAYSQFTGNGTGLRLDGAEPNLMEHNTFTASTAEGIHVSPGVTATLTDNDVSGSPVGIYCDSKVAEVYGNRVHGNTVGMTSTRGVLGPDNPPPFGTPGGKGPNDVYANETGVLVPSAASGVVVRFNRIHDNSVGIEQLGDNSLIIANDVHHNTTGIRGTGVLGPGSWGSELHNLVHHNDTGVWALSGAEARFDRIYDNTTGVYVEGDPLVHHNLIYGNTGAGVVLDGTVSAEVFNNTIYAAGGDGVCLQNFAAGVSLHDNVIWTATGYALKVAADSQFGYTSDYNNLYTGGTGKVAFQGTDFFDLYDWQVEAESDLHSIGYTVVDPGLDNPLFVNAGTGDFHLLAGSTSIDAGSPGAEYGLEPAPNGNRVDLGAYGNTPEAGLSADRWLRLTSPRYYADLVPSRTYTIAWETYNVPDGDTLDIDLVLEGGGWVADVATVTVGAGSTTWTPGNFVGNPNLTDRYRIQVTTSGVSSLTASSREAFSIPDIDPTAANTFYVDDRDATNANDEYTPLGAGDNRNTGTSALDPKVVLRPIVISYALDTGDQVLVDTGNYVHAVNLNLGGVPLAFDPRMNTVRDTLITGPTDVGRVARIYRENPHPGSVAIDLIDSDDMTLNHLQVLGAEIGVRVRQGSVNFSADQDAFLQHALDGLRIEGGSDNAILDNVTAAGNGRHGIFVDGLLTRITYAEVHDNGWIGIALRSVGPAVVEDSKVYLNQTGIDIINPGSGRATIGNNDLAQDRGNVVRNNREDGIFAAGNVLVGSNNVYENGRTGIRLDDGADALRNAVYSHATGISALGSTSDIIENRVANNTQDGILASFGSNVQRNVVYTNGRYGIHVDRFSGVIDHNLVYEDEQESIWVEGPGAGAQLINNTVYEPCRGGCDDPDPPPITGPGTGLVSGFVATTYQASLPAIVSLADAQSVIDNPANQSWSATAMAATVNFLNANAGHFGGDRPFPGMPNRAEYDQFVVRATGKVRVPGAGRWTFGVSSDDGFGLTLAGATFVAGSNYTAGTGGDTLVYDAPRGPGDTLGTFSFPAAGDYDLTLVYFENWGGAEVELWAAQGMKSVYDSTFRLVGDTANGGLSMGTWPGAGFTVTNYKASLGSISSLAEAQSVIDNPANQSWTAGEMAATINYLNANAGQFGGDSPFPSLPNTAEHDRFVVRVTGRVYIPNPGAWTFDVNSDDGFSLRVAGGLFVVGSNFTPGTGGDTLVYDALRGPDDTLGTFYFPAAGDYDLTLVYFENGGGAEVELWAAQGARAAFDPTFRLVGDTANGGLLAVSAPVGQFTVTSYRSGLGAIENLAQAQSVIDYPANRAWTAGETTATINYLNTGPAGRFAGDRPFPNMPNTADYDRFVVKAAGTVFIPSAGEWTFGVNSDDGFSLKLSGAVFISGSNFTPGTGGDTLVYDAPRPPGDTLGTFSFPAAGEYELTLLFFENTVGAEVELYAAEGAKAAFDSAFRLVGDTANGGLAMTGVHLHPHRDAPQDIGRYCAEIGIHVSTSSAYVLLRNNAVYVEGSRYPPSHVSHDIIVEADSTTGWRSDFNIFTTTEGFIGRWAGIEAPWLDDWQALSGDDPFSIDPPWYTIWVDPDGNDDLLGFRGLGPADGRDDNFHLRSPLGIVVQGALAPVADPDRLPAMQSVFWQFGVPENLSPGVDWGDPAYDYSAEPLEHGKFINLGAYGNTSQASLSEPQYVHMVYPLGFEELVFGETYEIRWRSQNPMDPTEMVKIELRHADETGALGAVEWVIADWTAPNWGPYPDTASYVWTVPAWPDPGLPPPFNPGGDYVIAISRGNNELSGLPPDAIGAGRRQFSVTATDSVAPWVVAADPLVVAYELPTNAPPSLITLEFSEDLFADAANSPDGYELRSAGANGTFDDGDDVLYPLAPFYSAGPWSSSPSTVNLSIPDAPLPEGQYRLTVFSVLLPDAAGNLLDGNGDDLPGGDYVRRFTVDQTNPTVFVPGVGASPRNSSVDQISIVFDEEVRGLGLADLRLTRDGGANLLTEANIPTTTDGITWTVPNLAQITADECSYTLDLTSANGDICDLAGNPLLTGTTMSWTTDTTPPKVEIVAVSPDPRGEGVSQVTLVFSEPVTNFDVADLTLSRDGGPNLLTAGQRPSSADGVTWTVTDLSTPTGDEGIYRLVVGSGVTDLAGNALAPAAEVWRVDTTAPQAHVAGVAPDPRRTAVDQIVIAFNEPVSGLDLADLTLTLGGGGNVLTGIEPLTSVDGMNWRLGGLLGLTAAPGQYLLTLTAAGSGIQDAAGNPLAQNAADSWLVDTTPPTVAITAVNSDPHRTPVNSITITFSEPVTGLDLADLVLRRDSGGNLLTTAQTLSTADNVEWVLGNLALLTALDGQYQLALTAAGSGIEDSAGNPLSDDATEAWLMDATRPSVDIIDVTPDPRTAAVSQISIVFSEPVEEFDLSDLVLVRNDGSNLLPGSSATLTTADSVTWILGNLSDLTGTVGAYALLLAAPNSQIADLAGNPLPRGTTETWVFESVAAPIEATAGVQFTAPLAAFCDPWIPGSPTAPQNFQAEIDWGDNNASAGTVRILGGDPASFEVLGAHRYARSSAFRSVDADGGNGPVELALTGYELTNPRVLHLTATNSSPTDTMRNVFFVQQYFWDSTNAANKVTFAWNNAQRSWQLGGKVCKTWGVSGQNALVSMDRDMIDTPLSWAIANGNAATVAVTDSLPAIGLGDLGPLQSRTFTWYIDYPYPFLLDMGVYLVAAREPAEYYLSITLSKPPLGESRVLTSAATVVTPAVRAWDGRSDNGAPSADAAWQTATNWAGDAAIQPGDALLFLAGAERLSNTNNFPAGTEFHSLAFPGGGYVIGGAQVGLSAGVVNKATASADNVLDLGIRLDAPQTFQNLSGSTLAVNGPIDTSGNALTIDGPGPVRLGGAISGQGALAKKGAGTTTLSGSNTYAGGTIVAEGTLEVETADALPAGGNLTIGAGATVALAGGLNASAASMAAATAIVGSREKAITLAEAVPASVRRATSAGAPALAVSPGTTIQRESLLAVAEEFQPAAWATRANISQLPARGSAAVVPQVPSRAAAIRDPAPSLPIAPSVQVKAHDAVLRSPALRPWDDAAWAWALDGAPDRRQASKKNVGPAAFAADQALALFLR